MTVPTRLEAALAEPEENPHDGTGNWWGPRREDQATVQARAEPESTLRTKHGLCISTRQKTDEAEKLGAEGSQLFCEYLEKKLDCWGWAGTTQGKVGAAEVSMHVSSPSSGCAAADWDGSPGVSSSPFTAGKKQQAAKG